MKRIIILILTVLVLSSIGYSMDVIRISGTVENSDSDNDSILDTNDKCPNTPMGFIVDLNGCSAKQYCMNHPIVYKWNKNKLIIDGNTSNLCLKADWRMNEPKLKFPLDCQVVRLDRYVYCSNAVGAD